MSGGSLGELTACLPVYVVQGGAVYAVMDHEVSEASKLVAEVVWQVDRQCRELQECKGQASAGGGMAGGARGGLRGLPAFPAFDRWSGVSRVLCAHRAGCCVLIMLGCVLIMPACHYSPMDLMDLNSHHI